MKNKLFIWFWRNWLKDTWGKPVKVIKIKGWRTALVETRWGIRYTTTFCPRWHPEGWKKIKW